MIVSFISQRVPFPPNKGEKIRTYHQIAKLREKGFDVVVFCPVGNREEHNNAEALKRCLGVKVITQQQPSKFWLLMKGLFTNKALSESSFYSKPLAKTFNDYLTKNTVRVVVLSASSLIPYIIKLINSQTLEFKLLVDLMDVDSDKWRQYAQSSTFPMNLLYRRECRLIRKLEQQVSQYSDACYLIAQAEVDLFKRNVDRQSHVKVLGNGIDTEQFYPPLDKSHSTRFTLLFTGVMDYKPNIDAVVWFVNNCWSEIVTSIPKAKFIIAGMNPSSEVKALADTVGVEVTGMVDDILPYFHNADVFVAPFRIARGVQNKVLQAFSCALPVISTSMGAEGIACTNEIDILIADTRSEFIEAVLKLHNSQKLQESLGHAAHLLINENYSWERQLRPLIDDIESLI